MFSSHLFNMASPSNILTCFRSQPQQAMQPQMTGIGSPYPPATSQGFVQQQPQMAPEKFAPPTQQFYSSVPLAVLGQASAPVDCPMCRHRTMTLTNPQVGNTTQYVCYKFMHCSMFPCYIQCSIVTACGPSVSVFSPAWDVFLT